MEFRQTMRTSDFDFTFPENLIAYDPLPRGEARLLVLDRNATSEPIITTTSAFPSFLGAGDALVLNDTRVLRARLIGTSASGSKVEALLLAPRKYPKEDINGQAGKSHASLCWEAMVKPGKRFEVGDQIRFSSEMVATVLEKLAGGTRVLDFCMPVPAFYNELEKNGKIPLPPYIKREASNADAQTYQSVFAEKLGSVAAPTASLHITEGMLETIRARGVKILKVTLHVGAGTFKPVQSEYLSEHAMHSEFFEMTQETADTLNSIRNQGHRIWAVGTTAARVLETQAIGNGDALFQPGQGETSIFIFPGYVWKAVDGLLTNFHWPKSTLFMLVCSMLGTERAKSIYADAFARGFRLFSYGDAMLIR
jgi:S-adenosylmethionine:tRNA ribosyltransferase-isomerase